MTIKPDADPMDETTLASQDESFALSATRASAGVPAGLDHTMASGAVAGADAGLVPGATTGRYILLEHLGAGAMGVVWSAWDPELDRRVAIKVLLRDTGRAQAEDRMRLQREAQSLARLAHPNVISVFDVGVFAERLFLAMEFVDGWTLRTWLREQHPARDAVHVAIAAAGRGLVAAHAAGLVHRDLKPDNVMIGRDGRVRVMDFGLARGLDQITGGTAGADPVLEQVRGLADTATELTQAGSLVGTPVYMAAELFQGMPADVRSDQFAFCVSAWEVLCGQRPFVGEDLKALKLAITSGRVTAPPADTLTRHQRATLERGLHPDPTRRWPSMEALLTALADDPTRGRRRRLGLALGFTLSAGALLGGYALTSGADRRCSDPAQQLAGTWDAVRSTELAAAIAGSGSPIAAATWPRVQMALDAWAGRWVAVAAPACLDQSTLAADLRPAQARCLAGQRAALDSLLKVLAGADADIVRNAQAAVAKLPDPQSCADPLVLASAVAPPAVALADTVERLDRAVDTARALRLAGKYAASEAAIRELLPELEATDYAPLTAEAQSELGDVLEQRSAFEESSATYTLALEHALRARDERQAAKLAVSLAAVLGARRHRVEESTLILRMAAAIARSLGDPTELAVQYEHTRAVIAVTNNAPAEARIWYEKELTRRRAENPDSPAVGDVLAGLGLVARNEGNLEEAARLALEVRAHYERTLVPDHPRIASAIDREGAILFDQGRYADAGNRFREALTMRTRALGPEHPETIDAASNLAGMLMMQGELTETEALYRQVLDARKRILDPGDTKIGTAMCNLAAVLDKTEGPAAARELYLAGTAIVEAARGPDDPELAWLLLNFASNRRAAGELAEALALGQRSAAIRERSLGPDHPFLAMSLQNVGDTQLMRGDVDAAITNIERAVKIWERVHGPDHPDVARGHTALARALLARRDLAGARKHAGLAMKAFMATGDGAKAAELPGLHAVLGEIETAEGALDAARLEYDKALALYGERPSLQRGEALQGLAKVLLRQRRPGPAREAMTRALADFAASKEASTQAEQARTWLLEHR